MQIELIGCTGAGKSTLARAILLGCREEELEISPGEQFVLQQLGLGWIESEPTRRLLVNLTGVCASLLTVRKNRQFYRFAARLLFQLSIPRVERLHLLRNVLKRIGIYEIVRLRQRDEEVVLVDEGPLQTAHNLFVHLCDEVTTEDLARFATLVPAPDVVVYLRQPVAVLIDRTAERGHRRLRDQTDDKVVRFVQRAVSVFEQLVQQPALTQRVVVVEGDRNRVQGASSEEEPAINVARRIVGYGLAGDLLVAPAGIALGAGVTPLPAYSGSPGENVS